jgi:aminopeptidase N
VSAATETFTATGCGAAFVNADARGYYVTEYEPEAIGALATRTPPLTTAERISLLGDEWRIVRAGRHDVGIYLDLATAFAGDVTPDVTAEIATRVTYVHGMIADPKERDAFAAWIRTTFRPALDAIGEAPKPGDSDDVLTRRGTLRTLIGLTAGDTALQASARALAERYLDNPSALPPSFAASVLQVAAAGGDATLYDRYLDAAKAALATPEQYYRVFNALASFRVPALADRTVAFALSPEVRSQDAPTLLGQLLNSSARDKTWSTLSTQWDAVSQRLGDFQALPYIVSALGGFCTAERAAEIRAFFAAHPVPAAARGLAQALERIDACVALDQRQSAPFTAWLAARPRT